MNEKQKHYHTKNNTNSIVYNVIMLHQCTNIYNVIFTIYIIAMASNSTPSPSEDNTSGTDLSIIPTEDEKQIRHNRLDTSKIQKNYNT